MNPKKINLGTDTATAFGLSSLATAAQYSVTVVNLTPSMYVTPVIVAAHSPATSMFVAGHAASPEMKAIAGGGDTAGMNALLQNAHASIDNGTGLVALCAAVDFTVAGSASDVAL